MMMDVDLMRISEKTQRHRGFTLVEVLVAVIILLIGVVAALRIFPPGFRALQESQETNRAMATMQAQIAEFQNHPESLPDAILPVDYSSPESLGWVKNFDFNDLSPIDYQGNPDKWLSSLKMPMSGNSSSWPLWEPISVRAMRRIVGERVVIPADLTNKKHVAWVTVAPLNSAVLTVDDTTNISAGMRLYLSDGATSQFVNVVSVNSATQVTIAETVTVLLNADLSTTEGGSPGYLPRFGPITPNMHWDTASSTFIADPAPLAIYDLRYRNVTLEQLQALAGNGAIGNDDFYYAVDYTAGTVYFLKPKVATTSVRFIFSMLDPLGKQVQVAGETQTLPDITADATGNQLIFTGMSDPVRTGSDATGQLYALQFPSGWKLIPGSEQFNRAYVFMKDVDPSALGAGQYTVELDQSGLTLNVLHFSHLDTGRTVKLDYTAADWNILHEDLAVDPQGYLNLSARNLKVGYLFNFPREPQPWGLLQPLLGDPLKYLQQDEVVRLVNLRTGASYQITTNAGTSPTPLYPKYFLQPSVPANSPLPGAVDMAQVAGGRIRIGQLMTDGDKFMVEKSAGSPEVSPFAGDTYRVFYRTRQDWTLQTYRAPAQFWCINTVGAPTSTELGWDRYNLAGNTIAVPGIYEGQTIAVDYLYDQGVAKARVSGEQHLIPHREVNGVSHVTLNNTPNGAISVRGVSVTVRTLWAQPRNATARRYTITEPKGAARTISERWQSKSMTVVLPATKE